MMKSHIILCSCLALLIPACGFISMGVTYLDSSGSVAWKGKVADWNSKGKMTMYLRDYEVPAGLNIQQREVLKLHPTLPLARDTNGRIALMYSSQLVGKIVSFRGRMSLIDVDGDSPIQVVVVEEVLKN